MTQQALVCLYCAEINALPKPADLELCVCTACGRELMPQVPIDVSPDIFAKAARFDAIPLIVDFWAPWCATSRLLKGELQDAASAFAGCIRAIAVNMEDDRHLSTAYAIDVLPTLAMFQNGVECWRQSGVKRAHLIEDWIRGRTSCLV